MTEVEQELKEKVEELADSKSKNNTPLSELQKIKDDNDALEKELMRREELRAKQMLAGKAQAGQYIPEKSPEEKAQEQAAAILKQFR